MPASWSTPDGSAPRPHANGSAITWRRQKPLESTSRLTKRWIPPSAGSSRSRWRATPAAIRARTISSRSRRSADRERSRPLTLTDLDDQEDEIVRRGDDADVEDAEVSWPAATTSVDLVPILDVLVAELRARGAAAVGVIGTFAIRREHDDENVHTVVRFRFRSLDTR
jgi:hypothetical protein